MMKLFVIPMLACACVAQAAETSIHRTLTSAQIPSRPLLGASEKSPPPLPAAVEFAPSGPPRVEDKYLLVLKGTLRNPLGRAIVLNTFGGNQINPFSLQPIDEHNFRWSTSYPMMPPAPAIATTQLIPAHSQVEYEARFDLSRLDYDGSPTVRFEWRFGFIRQREAQTGTVSVVLPSRTAPVAE